jgi:hypothetical protein
MRRITPCEESFSAKYSKECSGGKFSAQTKTNHRRRMFRRRNTSGRKFFGEKLSYAQNVLAKIIPSEKCSGEEFSAQAKNNPNDNSMCEEISYAKNVSAKNSLGTD